MGCLFSSFESKQEKEERIRQAEQEKFEMATHRACRKVKWATALEKRYPESLSDTSSTGSSRPGSIQQTSGTQKTSGRVAESEREKQQNLRKRNKQDGGKFGDLPRGYYGFHGLKELEGKSAQDYHYRLDMYHHTFGVPHFGRRHPDVRESDARRVEYLRKWPAHSVENPKLVSGWGHLEQSLRENQAWKRCRPALEAQLHMDRSSDGSSDLAPMGGYVAPDWLPNRGASIETLSSSSSDSGPRYPPRKGIRAAPVYPRAYITQ